MYSPAFPNSASHEGARGGFRGAASSSGGGGSSAALLRHSGSRSVDSPRAARRRGRPSVVASIGWLALAAALLAAARRGWILTDLATRRTSLPR